MITNHKNPYVGPRTFQREDRDLFFGRDREARDLMALITSERLILFYAQSGTGKSSILNTRLIPELEDNGFEVLPVGRIQGEALSGMDIDNIYIYNLMSRIVQQKTDLVSLAHVSLSQFLTALDLDESGYLFDQDAERLIKDALPWRRVLIIDQFEEIFTTHLDAWKKREDFFRQLTQAMKDDPYLSVILVMREDYIASLDPYAHILLGGLRTRYYMQRLTRDMALKAVKNPVEQLRPFAEGVAEKLVEDLASIVVHKSIDLQEVHSGQYVEPVQLQVVCYSLWDSLPSDGSQITESDLTEVGDVDQSLERFYDQRVAVVSNQKGIPERTIREWFGEDLITANKTRNMVLMGANGASVITEDVIQALKGDLVRAELRAGQIWYELTHDRLVEPVLASNAKWFEQHLSLFQRQATMWVQQGRSEGLLLRGRELQQAEQESATLELTADESAFLEACRGLRAREQRERRRNTLMTVLAIGATIAMIVAGVFWTEAQNAANQNAQLAKDNANVAATAQLAEELAKSAEQRAVDAQAVTEKTLKETEIELRKTRNQQLSIQSQLIGNESPSRALLLALEAIRLNQGNHEAISSSAYQALRDGLSNSFGIVLTGSTNNILALTFSLDGRWLASGGGDRTIQIWDLQSASFANEPAFTLPEQKSEIKFLAISNTGLLASGNGENNIYIWDFTKSTTNPIEITGGTGNIQNLVISPDGQWLAANRSDHIIRVWNLGGLDTSSIELFAFSVLTEDPGEEGIIFSSDGKWLLAACGTELRAWELTTNSPVENTIIVPSIAIDPWWEKNNIEVASLSYSFSKVTFSTDNKWFLSGGLAWRMDLFPYATPTSAEWNRWVQECTSKVFYLSYRSTECYARNFLSNITYATSAQGQWWAWSSKYFEYFQDYSIWVRNSQTEFRLEGHQGPVRQIVFSPDNHWLISASGSTQDRQGDGTIRFWDLTKTDPGKDPIVYYTGSENPLLSISSDGKWVVVTSDDQIVRLLDMQSMNFSQDPIGFNPVTNIFLSPDNKWLVGVTSPESTSSAQDPFYLPTRQTALLYDLSHPNPLTSGKLLGPYNAVFFSPDGKWGAWANYWSLWQGLVEAPQIQNMTDQKRFDLPLDLLKRFWFSGDERWLTAISTSRWGPLYQHLYDLSPLENTVSTTFTVPDNFSAQNSFSVFDWESQVDNNYPYQARIFFDSTNHWLFSSIGKDTLITDLLSSNPGPITYALKNISAFALSPDGESLATVDFTTSQAAIIHAEQMEPSKKIFPKTALQRVLFDGDRPVSSGFSADGNWMFLSTCQYVFQFDETTLRDQREPGCMQGGKTTVYLWHLSANDPSDNMIQVVGKGSFDVLFNPDSRWMRALDGAGKLTLLNLSTRPPIQIEAISKNNQFDLTGRWFANVEENGSLVLFDLLSSNLQEISITPAGYQLTSPAFSPNGVWLAAGATNGKVLLWEMKNEGPASTFYVLHGGKRTYDQILFTADGHWLFAGGPEEDFVGWHMDTQTLLEMACTSAGRNLTRAEWTQYGFAEDYRATCPQFPLEQE